MPFPLSITGTGTVMDDPKYIAGSGEHPLQGPHGRTLSTTRTESSFVPLKLILHPDGWAVELTQPNVVIGRHSSVDLRLHLPDVSRRHCCFSFADGAWQVIDLNSTNGVFVNNEQVPQAVLHHRDLVRIGSYTFQVDLTEAAPAEVQGPADDPLQRRAS
jgi:hypothetical protein